VTMWGTLFIVAEMKKASLTDIKSAKLQIKSPRDIKRHHQIFQIFSKFNTPFENKRNRLNKYDNLVCYYQNT